MIALLAGNCLCASIWLRHLASGCRGLSVMREWYNAATLTDRSSATGLCCMDDTDLQEAAAGTAQCAMHDMFSVGCLCRGLRWRRCVICPGESSSLAWQMRCAYPSFHTEHMLSRNFAPTLTKLWCAPLLQDYRFGTFLLPALAQD